MSEHRIVQTCVVVRDLNHSMEQYRKILGIEPWSVYTFNQDTLTEFKVRGQTVADFEYVLALGDLGDMQFELIQPVRNVPLYEDFLQQKGEGIHHIKELVGDEDLEARVDDFRQRGVAELVRGHFHGDTFIFFDTQATLGIIYEIGNCGDIPTPDRVYPA